MEDIRVFKFGGASVRDAGRIRSVAKILNSYPHQHLVIVVSATGKTTNALEAVIQSYCRGDATGALERLNKVGKDHFDIIQSLGFGQDHVIYEQIQQRLDHAAEILADSDATYYDYVYDQVVSFGELISTDIVHAFLQQSGHPVRLLDARQLIRTDNNYRNARVEWDQTLKRIRQHCLPVLEEEMVITQGFIGGTRENLTTTLGREGSDYTAAIFGQALNATGVTVWKDVPGVMNADPKLYPEAIKLEQLNYSDAVEMTFYGAQIIHPKTIRPLENNNIPLYVRSFLRPEEPGTVVDGEDRPDKIPVMVMKRNQTLLRCTTRDLSFITEGHMASLFTSLSGLQIKANMLKISAVTVSVCFDGDDKQEQALQQALEPTFKIEKRSGLELITQINYKSGELAKIQKGREVVLEERGLKAAQCLLD